MRTFEPGMQPCAQGDTRYEWIDELPTDAVAVKNKGPLIVAHSESGHHHQFNDPTGVTMFKTPNPFVCYLRMDGPALLEHMREFDTHEAIMFSPGIVRVKRQREMTPEGYQRMVAD